MAYSPLENEWRAKRFREDKMKRELALQSQSDAAEMGRLKEMGKQTRDFQQRESMAKEDAARNERVNKFYGERRYGSLLEARGRDDPTVQQAGAELGYDSGGFATSKRAGALRKAGQTTSGGVGGMTQKEKTEQYKAETERMGKFYDADQTLTPDDLKGLVGSGRSGSQNKALAAADPLGKTTQAPSKIYEGTVRRPTFGGADKNYRAFSDTQREGYNEYKPTRLVDPRQAPAPVQKSYATQKEAMPETYGDYGKSAEKKKNQSPKPGQSILQAAGYNPKSLESGSPGTIMSKTTTLGSFLSKIFPEWNKYSRSNDLYLKGLGNR